MIASLIKTIITKQLPEATWFGSCLTIQVIHLEEEPYLVFGRLPREPVHRRDELLQRDGARVVLVEDLEHSLREEWLATKWKKLVSYFGSSLKIMSTY